MRLLGVEWELAICLALARYLRLRANFQEFPEWDVYIS